MPIYENIAKAIGKEPLVRLSRSALACVAAAKDRHLLKTFGAELALTSGSKEMKVAVEEAGKPAGSIRDGFFPLQFGNPANAESHSRTAAGKTWIGAGSHQDEEAFAQSDRGGAGKLASPALRRYWPAEYLKRNFLRLRSGNAFFSSLGGRRMPIWI